MLDCVGSTRNLVNYTEHNCVVLMVFVDLTLRWMVAVTLTQLLSVYVF